MILHRAVGGAVAIVAAAGAATAVAGPAEDGNAGLEAMDRGDYHAAAHLFSLVIKAPDAAPDDKEFAYLNLGTIYLRQGHYVQATANLQNAIQLKPDDNEAQIQLELAQAGKNGADALTVRWGGVRVLDGGTWVATTSKEDRKHKVKFNPMYYLTYQWTTKGDALSFTGKDKVGSAVTGDVTRDPQTGVLTSTSTVNGKTETLYIEPTLNGYIEWGENSTVKVTVTPQDATTFNVVQESYKNNTWTRSASYQFVKSPDLARTLDKRIAGNRTKHCLGAGLAAGLVSGITGQDQPLPPECGGPQPAEADQQQ
ncbi:MAG TPA: tetratricopeptide repeat protein [Caulobacteraceae bacterium]|jgi:tetratricopeptide (TPR) repeat protein